MYLYKGISNVKSSSTPFTVNKNITLKMVVSYKKALVLNWHSDANVFERCLIG